MKNKCLVITPQLLLCFYHLYRERRQQARHQFGKAFLKNEELLWRLESQAKDHLLREKQLQVQQARIDSERTTLIRDQQLCQNERAAIERKKINEKFLHLLDDEKEFRKKIVDMEKKLDEKQALELQIERYRGALEVMKHLGADKDMKLKKEMDEIKENLQEKERRDGGSRKT
ncbi:hypothetical protein TIFTF001_000455 [Ficus carica]|uniref:Uncharacterized protein n=1 Tax=Ficus carica TaxID=3494 RepID=A0AA87YVT0_FICCA|nr:hypothetical protein TIFTF001_000455 [Ficus carica]